MATVQGRALRVHVAAFGKHPGWDDHIEEIGLDCDALVRAKRVLYSEGVAGNIDSGSWEKLGDEQRLPGFAHNWYWRMGQDLIVGRMWSSRDGKGRTKYPMVVCAMIDGSAPAWAISRILPRLAAIEEACAGTQSAELVRLTIGEARRGLEDEAGLESAQPTASPNARADALKRLLASEELSLPSGENGASGAQLGLIRVLYEIDREMGTYLIRGGRRTSTMGSQSTAQHIRVPRGVASSADAASGWFALLGQVLSASAPTMLLEPRDQPFIDVIVGDPKPAQLFCIRAGVKGLPLTSSVPYTIEEGFIAASRAKIAEWATGLAADQVRPGAADTSAAAVSKVSGKKALLAIGGGGVLFFVILLLIVMSGGKKTPEDAANGAGGGTTPEAPVTPVTPKPSNTAASGSAPSPGNASGASSPKPSEPARAQAASPTSPATPDPALAGKGASNVATPPSSNTAPALPPSQPPAPTPTPPPTKPVATPPSNATGPAVTAPAPSPAREGSDPRASWRTSAARAPLFERIGLLERELVAEGVGASEPIRAMVREAFQNVDRVDAMTFNPAERAIMERAMATADASMAKASSGVEQGIKDSSERLSSWLKGQKSPVASGPLSEAWRQAVDAIAPGEGWTSARARVEEASGLVKRGEAAIAAAPGLSIPARLGANEPALREKDGAVRQQAIERVAAGVTARDAAMIDEGGARLRAWSEAASALLGDADALEAAFAGGYGLAEPDATGTTVQTRLERMRASEAYAPLQAPLGPTLQRAEGLVALSDATTPEPLIESLSASRQDQSRVRASEAALAWERLAGLEWPRTPEALASAGEILSRDLAPVIARAEPESRRAALQARVDDGSRKMWSGFAQAAAPSDDGLSALRASAAALKVRPEDEAALPERVRYNLARAQLIQSIKASESLSAGQRAAAQQTATAAFLRAVEPLGGVKADPAAQGLIAALEPIASAKVQLDLSKLGPGSVSHGRMVESEGERAVFELDRKDGTKLRVEFVRVEPAGSEDVSFVSTSEASIALAAEMLGRATGWPSGVKNALPQGFENATDQRQGPEIWRFNASRGLLEAIRPPATNSSRGWVANPDASALGGKPFYGDLPVPAAPSAESPMQHITPVGAALVARIAGCRLPTAAEWAAARTKGDVGPPNLRDVTWRKVFDRFQGSAPMQQALMAGGFRGAATGRDDGKVASTQDDGVIWLRPTDAGKIGEGAAFRDLVGNVAEFVFESPAALEKAPATAAGVLAVLAKDSIRVIGGSALSPESVEPATPQTLGSANPGIANFSDVGFRLAFTAPRAAGAAGAAERIQGALSAHGYLKK